MFLTFLCDINLRLIVGSALLIGIGDFCLHLSCSYMGKVKGSNVPPVLILGCSDIYWTTNPQYALCKELMRLWGKRKKNQTGLTFSRFSMKYQTALRQQTWYNQDTLKNEKIKK